jgi:hypothetical protein
MMPTPIGKGGVGRKMFEPAIRAMNKGGKALPWAERMARAVPLGYAGGAGLEASIKATERLGAKARGEAPQDLGDALRDIHASGAIGGAFTGGFESAASLAGAAAEALRRGGMPRAMRLRKVEAAGGGTALPGFGEGGLKPPPAYAEEAKRIAKGHMEAVEKGTAGVMPVEAPLDVMGKRLAKKALPFIDEVEAQTTMKIHVADEGFMKSGEGQQKVSVRGIIEGIQSLIDEARTTKGAVPATDVTKLQKLLRDFHGAEAVPESSFPAYRKYNEGAILIDPAIKPTAEQIKVGREMYGRHVPEGEFRLVLSDNRLDAFHLEKSLGGLNEMLKEAQNRRGGDPALARVQALMYDAREEFRGNQYTQYDDGSPMRAVVDLANGQKKVVRNWAAKKALDHLELNKVESLKAAGNLRNVDRYEPTVADQLQGLVNALKGSGESSRTVFYDVFRTELEKRPALQKELADLIGGIAFEEHAGAEALRVIAGRGGVSAFASGAVGSLPYYFDPIMKGAAAFRGRTAPAAAVTSQRRHEVGTAAEQAQAVAGKAMGISAGLMKKIYQALGDYYLQGSPIEEQ